MIEVGEGRGLEFVFESGKAGERVVLRDQAHAAAVDEAVH